ASSRSDWIPLRQTRHETRASEARDEAHPRSRRCPPQAPRPSWAAPPSDRRWRAPRRHTTLGRRRSPTTSRESPPAVEAALSHRPCSAYRGQEKAPFGLIHHCALGTGCRPATWRFSREGADVPSAILSFLSFPCAPSSLRALVRPPRVLTSRQRRKRTNRHVVSVRIPVQRRRAALSAASAG